MSLHIDIRAGNVLILFFSTVPNSVYFLQKVVVCICIYLLCHIIARVGDCHNITNVPRFFLCLLFIVRERDNSSRFRKSISAWIHELHNTSEVPKTWCQKLVHIDTLKNVVSMYLSMRFLLSYLHKLIMRPLYTCSQNFEKRLVASSCLPLRLTVPPHETTRLPPIGFS